MAIQRGGHRHCAIDLSHVLGKITSLYMAAVSGTEIKSVLSALNMHVGNVFWPKWEDLMKETHAAICRCMYRVVY